MGDVRKTPSLTFDEKLKLGYSYNSIALVMNYFKVRIYMLCHRQHVIQHTDGSVTIKIYERSTHRYAPVYNFIGTIEA